MNGIFEKTPFKYTIIDTTFVVKAIIEISNWKALDALHKMCEAMHTGIDGVSKTRIDVAVGITSKFYAFLYKQEILYTS